MLSDSSHEIRQQADSALSEFLQEIKNSAVRLLLNAKFCFLFYSMLSYLPFPILCQALSFFLFLRLCLNHKIVLF